MKSRYVYIKRLTVLSVIVYGLFSYWGIRAPDSEVVYLTTESLATKGTFAVSAESAWHGFGLPEGKDGKCYSLFGPGLAIMAVPAYALAQNIADTEWVNNPDFPVNISHFTHNGVRLYIGNTRPDDITPHVMRMTACLTNVVCGTLCVFVFFLIIEAITGSCTSALLTSILFAFGTQLLPYSGTFFSEVLATFFALLSFYCIIVSYRMEQSPPVFVYGIAGVLLGMACATHITAILFAPFFCILAACSNRDKTQSPILTITTRAVLFSAGLCLILGLLGYFNYVRFGSALETGRSVGDTSIFGYGNWIAPWRGLSGLLTGANKGLFIYCPAVILGFICWRPFHRKYKLMSYTLAGAAVLRLLFISMRSDWHGGFCVGPRYLVMLVPFLLLPVGLAIHQWRSNGNVRSIIIFGMASLACIAQQLLISLGEIFSYFHIVTLKGMLNDVDVFEGEAIYLKWKYCSLFHLLDGFRGPMMLKQVALNNHTLWILLVLLTALSLMYCYMRMLKGDANK